MKYFSGNGSSTSGGIVGPFDKPKALHTADYRSVEPTFSYIWINVKKYIYIPLKGNIYCFWYVVNMVWISPICALLCPRPVVAVPASAITEEVVEEEFQQAPPPRKRKADHSNNQSSLKEKVSKQGGTITQMGCMILCLENLSCSIEKNLETKSSKTSWRLSASMVLVCFHFFVGLCYAAFVALCAFGFTVWLWRCWWCSWYC